MSLATLRMLGPYQILDQIGAGAMGEVYRARDTRLDRIVAVKVLSATTLAKPEVVVRFEREARAASSLNNPHICSLYDVGREGGIEFLVMEYLDGETLLERLLKGPIPRDQAVLWAIQMAEALDHAHRKQLIHRDLKPANIMLTKSGLKLLDFGLAKSPEAPACAATVTVEGTLLGTLSYMSPEQVEGRVADERSDIFAFGVVLFKMITGRRPFDAESPAGVIAAILTQEPPRLESGHLDHIVRRCLPKDPNERWQTARDLMLELEWLGEEVGEAAESDLTPPTTQPATHWGRTRLPWAALALLAFTLLGVGWLGWRTYQRPGPAEIRFTVAAPEKAAVASFAMSPDGHTLAFTAQQDGKSRLWVRPLDSTEPHALEGTEGASYPFWSPDSGSLGFFAEGKLKKAHAAGGSPEVLCDAPLGNGGSWNPDGVIVFTPDIFEGLYRVSSSGGRPVPLTKLDRAHNENSHRWPQFLPDGQHFLFLNRAKPSYIYLGRLGSPEATRLMESTSSAIYSRGQLLFSRGNTLMARPFDSASARFTGEAFPVTSRVGADPLRNWGFFSASQEGSLALRQFGEEGGMHQVVWLDRSGAQHGAARWTGAYLSLSVSPDGSKIAVQHSENSDVLATWLLDARSGSSRRLAIDDAFPVWSRDGSRVAMMRRRNGIFGFVIKEVNGGEKSELLAQSSDSKFPLDWSPDNRMILFQQRSPDTNDDLMLVPADGSGPAVPLIHSARNEVDGKISPNGNWVAYVSDEVGRREVYVEPFRTGTRGARWQISSAGGGKPMWSPTGDELFFISPDRKLMAVPVRASADKFEALAPKALFPTRLDPRERGQQYQPSPDGKGFWFLQPPAADNSPITVVLHWTPKPH